MYIKIFFVNIAKFVESVFLSPKDFAGLTNSYAILLMALPAKSNSGVKLKRFHYLLLLQLG